MGNLEKFLGQNPEMRDYINAIGDLLADDVSVVVLPANPTPAPTSAAGSYTVPFEIRSARTGDILPINGTIGAAAGQSTSGGGTGAVSSATPAVRMGRGTVNLTHTTGTWANADTVTLTLTYTNIKSGTKTDTFVVTFTTP